MKNESIYLDGYSFLSALLYVYGCIWYKADLICWINVFRHIWEPVFEMLAKAK